jgi:hypothetical protein
VFLKQTNKHRIEDIDRDESETVLLAAYIGQLAVFVLVFFCMKGDNKERERERERERRSVL